MQTHHKISDTSHYNPINTTPKISDTSLQWCIHRPGCSSRLGHKKSTLVERQALEAMATAVIATWVMVEVMATAVPATWVMVEAMATVVLATWVMVEAIAMAVTATWVMVEVIAMAMTATSERPVQQA
ncbi:hypothetical protein SLEP1_g15174 [Rubroshorea leprosula]|uniref:Uncharacterized protein n=1 Tax=Rubroshorea leprosula TaxID=152421 RepID=A0AAV5IXA4_9ROSI|nr:hypothetical protein SLEP1_g15174 [Rubroshorea leprosula]